MGSVVDIDALVLFERLREEVGLDQDEGISLPRLGEGVPSGRFIVLEGVDGCGKTVVARRLVDALVPRLERSPFYTREPHHEGVRRLLKQEDDHRVRFLAYVLDRAIHVRRVQVALRDGHWVIGDRYLYSTLVYNPVPVHDGLFTQDEFERFVLWAAGGLLPDAVIYLRVEPEVALQRMLERGGTDPMADLSLLREAVVRYDQLSDIHGFHVVDASRGIDQVVGDCLSFLMERFDVR